jgi:hypothetical protein
MSSRWRGERNRTYKGSLQPPLVEARDHFTLEGPLAPSRTIIVSVTFATNVQASGGRFSIPRDVTRVLGLKSRAKIGLFISKASGEPIYFGEQKLKSGTEIYGANDIGRALRLNKADRIWVQASVVP